MASPPPVAQFGKYLLDREIAVGGMARVYLARLRGLGGFEKKLVVKQIRPELGSDPRFISMFVEEAKTVVQMSHPNIVSVFELGVVDGVYFIAMEHVEGAALSQILREGPLNPALVAHVGVQVADALEYAHSRFGLLHRDVTPRNVLVDTGGHVHLVDFGIAAPAQGSGGETEVFGSHGYMSPEQAKGKSLTPASDVFSLGVVLYECATGEPAFLRGTAEATLAALIHGTVDPLEGMPAVPTQLARAIDKAIDREVVARTQSATALGRALRAYLAGEHPEGVGGELGARAESARRAAERGSMPAPPHSDRPASDQTAPIRRDVRSIATSAVLVEMFPGAIEPPPSLAPTGGSNLRGTRGTPSDEAESTNLESNDAVVTRRDATLKKFRTQPEASPPPTPGGGSQVVSDRPTNVRVNVALGLAALAAVFIVAWRVGSVSLAGPKVAADSGSALQSSGRLDASAVGASEHVDASAPVDVTRVEDAEARTTHDAVRPEVATGVVALNASPWAEVKLGRRSLGNTPLRRVSLPIGKARLTFSCPPLGREAIVNVDVTDEARSVFVDLSVDPPAITVR